MSLKIFTHFGDFDVTEGVFVNPSGDYAPILTFSHVPYADRYLPDTCLTEMSPFNLLFFDGKVKIYRPSDFLSSVSNFVIEGYPCELISSCFFDFGLYGLFRFPGCFRIYRLLDMSCTDAQPGDSSFSFYGTKLIDSFRKPLMCDLDLHLYSTRRH